MGDIDRFFEVLLVDDAIMYNVYNPSSKTLVITYNDATFTYDLSSFAESYSNRKKYTLQSAGLYLYACDLFEFNNTLTQDAILANYIKFKQMDKDKSNLVSLILVTISSFLLPVYSHHVNIGVKMRESPPETIKVKTGSGTSIAFLAVAIAALIVLIYYTAHKK